MLSMEMSLSRGYQIGITNHLVPQLASILTDTGCLGKAEPPHAVSCVDEELDHGLCQSSSRA